jgi:cell division ATPase FtsA
MHFLRRFYQQTTQSPRAYSLIDIGRDTVKAVVVQVKPGAVAEVVGYGLAETGGYDITGGRLEASEVVSPVNIALTLAEDHTESLLGQKLVPDDVIFAITGQATTGKLFTIRHIRPQPRQPISKKELRQLRAKAERTVRQGLTELHRDGGRWRALAVNDVGLRLDSYLVVEGLGRTGREMSLSLFGVTAQAGAWRALEEVAERLNLRVVEVVAASQALASLVPHPEAIVLDVGFSGTTLCLLKNDALVGSQWLPFGDDFFLRPLTEVLQIGLSEAKRLKQEWFAGELRADEVHFIEAQLGKARQRWYEEVMLALLELTKGVPLPWKIYLTGGGSLFPGLEALLVSDPDHFDRAPEVTRINKSSVMGLKDLTDGLNYDLFALTLSLVVGLPAR